MKYYYGQYCNEIYKPWDNDILFHQTLDQIKNNTAVDLWRCYELWTSIEQVAKLEGDIIEIGVWRGGTSALMARKLELMKQDAKLYACDTFQGLVKVSENDNYHKNGEFSNTSIDIVTNLYNNMCIKDIELLIGIFPDDTGRFVSDKKFKLCHIDVDIYQSAIDVLDFIWPRLVSGGIIIYDDYGVQTTQGIAKAVNEQMHLSDRHVFYNLNGHAIVVKL